MYRRYLLFPLTECMVMFIVHLRTELYMPSCSNLLASDIRLKAEESFRTAAICLPYTNQNILLQVILHGPKVTDAGIAPAS